jgi:hypothetical protein
MNENKPMPGFATSGIITDQSKVLGLDDYGNTILFKLSQLRSNNIGQFKITDATPPVPLLNQNYELVGTAIGTSPSGTYSNLKGVGNVAIVIPAPATGHAIINARAVWNGSYWVPVWQDVTLPAGATGAPGAQGVPGPAGPPDTTTLQYFKIDAAGNLNFTDDNGNIGAVLKSDGTFIINNLVLKNQVAQFVLNALKTGALTTDTINGNYINQNDKYAFVVTDNSGNIAFAVNLDGTIIGQGISSVAGSKRITGMLADVNHYVVYGQSLSVGAYGTPLISTVTENSVYTFHKGPIMNAYDSDSTKYNSLDLEVESTTETPGGAMGRMIKQQIITDGFTLDGATNLYDVLVSSPGLGSQTIAQLSKGTANYQRFIDGVTNGFALANAAGKTYNLPAVFWLQGEANNGNTDKATYKTALIKLRDDINTDVKAITGQKNDVVFLCYQMASNNWSSLVYPTIAIALNELCLSGQPGFYQGPPLYPYTPSSDRLHLTGPGYATIGAIAGYILKKIIVDGVEWKPIYVQDYTINANVLNLRFYVPVAPLVLDTTLVTDPGNYGFRLFDSTGNELTITSVTKPRPATIRITANVPIAAGMRLTYAINGAAATSGPINGTRGCVRDSQGNTLKYQPAGVNYPVHNWLPMFDKTL